MCEKIKNGVNDGKSIIILSDREIKEGESPLPSLLTTAKVHHFLIEEGIRLKASIIVATGEVRDSHDLACHIAYGSSAVWPYLALERVRQIAINNKDIDMNLRMHKKTTEML